VTQSSAKTVDISSGSPLDSGISTSNSSVSKRQRRDEEADVFSKLMNKFDNETQNESQITFLSSLAESMKATAESLSAQAENTRVQTQISQELLAMLREFNKKK